MPATKLLDGRREVPLAVASWSWWRAVVSRRAVVAPLWPVGPATPTPEGCVVLEVRQFDIGDPAFVLDENIRRGFSGDQDVVVVALHGFECGQPHVVCRRRRRRHGPRE